MELIFIINIIKMNTVYWGIIGCGNVVEVKSGPAFQKVKNSELIAVMRRNAEKAKDFAQRHKVPFWYNSIDEILENKQINAIYIATPPSTHLEIVKKCLKAKKFVYLEKPITLNFSEATELESILTNDDKVVVAHYRRELPAFKKVKELIDSNVIGKIQFADIQILQSKKNNFKINFETNWRVQPEISGGGYFHDLAPHHIDLMYHYFGEIENAKGFSASLKNNAVDDIINGIIEFKNGVQFRGIWNFNASEKNEKDECKIYGEKGVITFSFFGSDVFLSTDKDETTFNFSNPKHVQEAMIKETVSYFLGDGENPCKVKEASKVMKVIDLFTGKL